MIKKIVPFFLFSYASSFALLVYIHQVHFKLTSHQITLQIGWSAGREYTENHVDLCVIGCLWRRCYWQYLRHIISANFLRLTQATMLILNSPGTAHFSVMNICAGKWSVEQDDSGSSFNCIWCCALLNCLLIITHQRLATHLQGSPAASYSCWHLLNQSALTHMLTRNTHMNTCLHTHTHTWLWKDEN